MEVHMLWLLREPCIKVKALRPCRPSLGLLTGRSEKFLKLGLAVGSDSPAIRHSLTEIWVQPSINTTRIVTIRFPYMR